MEPVKEANGRLLGLIVVRVGFFFGIFHWSRRLGSWLEIRVWFWLFRFLAAFREELRGIVHVGMDGSTPQGCLANFGSIRLDFGVSEMIAKS